MENDVMVYATTYFAFRVATLAGIGYAFYRALRPRRATVRSVVNRDPRTRWRARPMADDRC